jgi:hypothetical protein
MHRANLFMAVAITGAAMHCHAADRVGGCRCSASQPQRPRAAAANSLPRRIDYLIAHINDDPPEGHGLGTPAVLRLIGIGEAVLEPLLDHIQKADEQSRGRMQLVFGEVVKDMFVGEALRAVNATFDATEDDAAALEAAIENAFSGVWHAMGGLEDRGEGRSLGDSVRRWRRWLAARHSRQKTRTGSGG